MLLRQSVGHLMLERSSEPLAIASDSLPDMVAGWTVDVEGIFAGHCTINMYDNQVMIHTINRSGKGEGRDWMMLWIQEGTTNRSG